MVKPQNTMVIPYCNTIVAGEQCGFLYNLVLYPIHHVSRRIPTYPGRILEYPKARVPHSRRRLWILAGVRTCYVVAHSPYRRYHTIYHGKWYDNPMVFRGNTMVIPYHVPYQISARPVANTTEYHTITKYHGIYQIPWYPTPASELCRLSSLTSYDL